MSEVLLSSPAPHVAQLTLNRPDKRNALNDALRRQLTEHVQAISQSREHRVLIITGGPQVFAAGADLKELSDATPFDLEQKPAAAMWQTLQRCPLPIIAAVNGFAWGGGCELAMHADLIIAGKSASFAQPEIKVGIMPGAGGTQRFVRALGKHRAMHFLLSGKPLTAEEAFSRGLVSELTEDDATLSTAMARATELVALPPLAVRLLKDAVNASQELGLSQGLAYERRNFQMLFASQDQKEGMKAFFEKRPAQYQGT
jgi:enoyl-CoA hydratase/carnithine racemase